MIRFHHIFVILCCIAFSACSSDNSIVNEDAPMVTAIVPDKILYVDEDELDAKERITRSTLAYDKYNTKMIFSWNTTDAIGVFNVSNGLKDANTEFKYKSLVSTTNTSSTAKFYNGFFSFDSDKYWVAYSPYKIITSEGLFKKPLSRDEIIITYKGQKALSNGTPNGLKPSANTTMESEARASSHLGTYDYMISDPIKTAEEGAMTFHFKHIGSTMRLYMQFPEWSFGGPGKNGKVKSLRVLTPNENLIVSDAILQINDNPSGTDASYTVKERTYTDNIELKFLGDDGTGIVVPDNGFLISYMEFFPTKIPSENALLHLTVEVDGVEKYFRSKWMTAVNIGSGYIYQWTAKQYDEPIELTATLQSWQDIVTGLSTDLEK